MPAKRYAPASPQQKLICAVLLVAMLTGWSVYFAGWRLFGGYEKQVAMAVQLVTMLYAIRLLALLDRS